MKRWHILLLSAGVALFAFMSLMFYGASAVIYRASPPNPLSAGVYFFFLSGWLNWLVSQVLYVAALWAGFVLPSRRPSRRKAAAIILLGISALTILGLRIGYIGMPGFPLVVLLQTVLSMLSYAGGLAYLYMSRNDEAVKPRLALAAVAPEPADNHVKVPAAIKDDGDWHASLLASLAHTGQQQTQAPKRWPLFAGIVAVLLAGRLFAWVFETLTGRNGPQLWASYVETIVLLVLFAFPLALLRRRYWQAKAKRAEDSLKKSDRRPIFYLRSFALDDVLGQPSILELFFNVNIANAEQSLTARLARCGPVIAIGRPSEKLPSLGASRFYVSDELWQEKVADVATVARLVVWASGTTPGLQWEISHLVRELPPEKLILWAHPHLLDLDAPEREAEWAAFVDGLGQLFPKPLPKPLGKTQYFAFGPDFTPIPYAPRLFAPALPQILTEKKLPPFDAEGVKKTQGRRRLVLAIAGAVAGVVVLGLSGLMLTRLWPSEPKPAEWHLLAGDIIHDELAQSELSPSDVEPRPADKIIYSLQATQETLKGKWFGSNWEHVPPGRLGGLRKVLKDYQAMVTVAHGRSDVEDMFYGRGTALFITVSSGSEAEQRLRDLVDLRNALATSEKEWAGIVSQTSGWTFPVRLHAVLMARQRLLEAETSVLRQMSSHADEWYPSRNDDGSPTIKCSGPGDSFCAMAQGLSQTRESAARALNQAQTDAFLGTE